MKDIDNLAAAIVAAAGALIIALPLKIVRSARKVAKNKLRRPSAGALHRWHLPNLKRSPKGAAKTAGSVLDSHKMQYEELENKKVKGGKNVKRTPR
jgi:hypothetical protein